MRINNDIEYTSLNKKEEDFRKVTQDSVRSVLHLKHDKGTFNTYPLFTLISFCVGNYYIENSETIPPNCEESIEESYLEDVQ